MPFLNECEECGNDYQADAKGRETWFTLCASCLAKDPAGQAFSDAQKDIGEEEAWEN